MIKKILNLLYKAPLMNHQQEEKKVIQCCDQSHIQIDDYLFQQIFDNNIAIFAGAGISTENKFVYPVTFYEEIAQELDLSGENLSFPDLMEKFTKQVDGRARLIKKIQDRFDHLNSFGFTRWASTRFHNELATLYPIKTIITTNWDLFFEEYCKAIPYVHEQDMVFWDDAKRNVLKIHGSINSYGSIIATSHDYKKAEEKLNKGLLGSKLKTILTEKNIVFIGYSFRDADFKEIYYYVKNTLGDFSKQSYVITPFKDEAKKFQELGFIPIITDGTHFIKLIKQKAIQQKLLLPDSTYEYAKDLLSYINDVHIETSKNFISKKYPHIIYTLAYQDGMIDALERGINFQATGEYSDPKSLNKIIKGYEESIANREKENRNETINDILDICYIEGYINGLVVFFIDKNKDTHPPFYYLDKYGEIDDEKEFEKALKEYPTKFSKQYNKAYNLTKTFPDGGEYHHPPRLF